MVRIGSDVAARMPRRAAGAHMGKAEAQWLRVLAPRLPIRIPTPLALGVPGSNYPWDWSIVPWVDGDNAAVQLPATSEAERFGFFLRALHTPPPDGLPFNPSRSVSLKQRDDEARVRRLSNEGWELWTAAAEEDIDIASSWIHGDLHPRMSSLPTERSSRLSTGAIRARATPQRTSHHFGCCFLARNPRFEKAMGRLAPRRG